MDLNLIRLFDFYLAMMLVFSIYRRWPVYRDALLLVVGFLFGRWGRLLTRLHQHLDGEGGAAGHARPRQPEPDGRRSGEGSPAAVGRDAGLGHVVGQHAGDFAVDLRSDSMDALVVQMTNAPAMTNSEMGLVR